MNCTAAIINWNSGGRLAVCVESLLATTPGVDILVIDNASTDGSADALEAYRNRIHIARNSTNRGFSGAANQAFAETRTPYVLLLNPDIRVEAGAIPLLLQTLESHPGAAAAGGNVNSGYWPRPAASWRLLVRENLGIPHRPDPFETDAVAVPVEQPAAAALMIRRDAFDSVGGFDERFQPAWYEDVDFCRRLTAAGWELYFVPAARFAHEGGYSAGRLGPVEFAAAYYHNQLRYAQKHMGAAARLAVRASLAAGMMGRCLTRPKSIRAYGGVLLGALGRW